MSHPEEQQHNQEHDGFEAVESGMSFDDLPTAYQEITPEDATPEEILRAWIASEDARDTAEDEKVALVREGMIEKGSENYTKLREKAREFSIEIEELIAGNPELSSLAKSQRELTDKYSKLPFKDERRVDVGREVSSLQRALKQHPLIVNAEHLINLTFQQDLGEENLPLYWTEDPLALTYIDYGLLPPRLKFDGDITGFFSIGNVSSGKDQAQLSLYQGMSYIRLDSPEGVYAAAEIAYGQGGTTQINNPFGFELPKSIDESLNPDRFIGEQAARWLNTPGAGVVRDEIRGE